MSPACEPSGKFIRPGNGVVGVSHMTAESNRGADGTFVCVWRDPPEPTTERLAPGGDIYAALSADGALTPGSTLYHPLFVGVRFHAPIAGGALTASRDPAPPNVAVLLRGLQHRNDAAADVAARGGALYSACERAGARGTWGALDARTRYYAWAPRAADGGGLRIIALREQKRGCVELQFDRRADRVVLAAPRAGVALGGSPGAAAAKPASADEPGAAASRRSAAAPRMRRRRRRHRRRRRQRRPRRASCVTRSTSRRARASRSTRRPSSRG